MSLPNIILFLAGVVIIWISAGRFVSAGATAARGLGVSDLTIGLTLGALGTSMPELMVSWISAVGGNTSIAIGNVVGSNMANIGLALGIGALIYPVSVEKNILKSGYWIVPASAFLFYLFTLNLNFSRAEGIIFLILFAGYLRMLAAGHRNSKYVPEKIKGESSVTRGVVIFILSSAGLFAGARLMVLKGAAIAGALGVSQAVIAIAVIAIGTSLPEIAVVVAGSVKKAAGISFGTIIGSNIINIMLIAGGSAAIRPVIINAKENIFMAPSVFALSLILFVIVFIGRRRIGRIKGAILLVLYCIYIAALI